MVSAVAVSTARTRRRDHPQLGDVEELVSLRYSLMGGFRDPPSSARPVGSRPGLGATRAAPRRPTVKDEAPSALSVPADDRPQLLDAEPEHGTGLGRGAGPRLDDGDALRVRLDQPDLLHPRAR